MDKRNTYFKLKDMLASHDKKMITIADLRRLIIINIGSTERTIQSCLKIMGETGLIQDLGDFKFKVL